MDIKQIIKKIKFTLNSSLDLLSELQANLPYPENELTKELVLNLHNLSKSQHTQSNSDNELYPLYLIKKFTQSIEEIVHYYESGDLTEGKPKELLDQISRAVRDQLDDLTPFSGNKKPWYISFKKILDELQVELAAFTDALEVESLSVLKTPQIKPTSLISRDNFFAALSRWVDDMDKLAFLKLLQSVRVEYCGPTFMSRLIPRYKNISDTIATLNESNSVTNSRTLTSILLNGDIQPSSLNSRLLTKLLQSIRESITRSNDSQIDPQLLTLLDINFDKKDHQNFIACLQKEAREYYFSTLMVVQESTKELSPVSKLGLFSTRIESSSDDLNNIDLIYNFFYK